MPSIRRALSRIPLGILIALTAAGYAGIENYEDMQPGTHHGVAILNLAELVEDVKQIENPRLAKNWPRLSEGTPEVRCMTVLLKCTSNVVFSSVHVA